MTKTISVVIPTLNEAEDIVQTIQSVQSVPGVEIVVVDGGSTDETVRRAATCGVRLLSAAPGRAMQMNIGAGEAAGDIILFLHADTRPPQGFENHVRRALTPPDTVAGAFSLSIDADAVGLRIIERLTNWRSRHFQMPYGDQGIFLRAEHFRAMGGFPEMPLMEDFEFIRRLRKRGRIAIVPIPIRTSGRRWRSLGVLRTTLINQAVILGYLAGVAPSRLACWYYGKRGRGKGSIIKTCTKSILVVRIRNAHVSPRLFRETR